MPFGSRTSSSSTPRGSSSSTSTSASRWPQDWPPKDEAREQKRARQASESRAKKVSDEIDRALEAERRSYEKHSTKVLLLGQAESGKSTLLKNIQLAFTPAAFRAEREAWRVVIHLNVCRTVNFLVDLLERSERSKGRQGASSSSGHGDADGNAVVPGSQSGSEDGHEFEAVVDILHRLAPLREVELTLHRRISDAGPGARKYERTRAAEVSLRAGVCWRTAILGGLGAAGKTASANAELKSAAQTLHACAADIERLCMHPRTERVLRRHGICLEEQPGFFLDQITHVTAPDYVPTSEDILRARLETIGVEEHSLKIEVDSNANDQWIIYDVSGRRNHRAAWAPFFDHVTTIVFMAPISAFDEILAEDPSVNRLLDSFELWTQICSNELVQRIPLIILLNKCDILRSKLRAGTRFKKFISSYPESEPNEASNVQRFLKNKFTSIHTNHSRMPRRLHLHLTCAVDISAMLVTLKEVRELVLVRNLTRLDII